MFRRAAKYDTVPPVVANTTGPAILVFSKTNGFRHEGAIRGANAAIASIAERSGWSVFFTENGAVFNPMDLSHFRATIWNNTSGEVLNATQKDSFRSYVESGARFVGLHGAGGDFSYNWSWYVDTLIGAQFIGHTVFPRFPTAAIRIEGHDNPATAKLPKEWVRSDEWYSFDKSPRANGATIVATVDETSCRPRMAWKNIRMGQTIPWSGSIPSATADPSTPR